MNFEEAIAAAREAITVRRVYGDPVERDGVIVIPAATVAGGSGGGSGEDPESERTGSGGGFGLVARPAGAYVIDAEGVRWEPAHDPRGVMLRAAVAALGLLLLWARRGGR